MKKQLILVDQYDSPIGYGEKIQTHINGQLHRAYSVFIYCKDEKKLLLQKRNKEKYHSGEKWSNSFCSHPYCGESWFEALQRGALDELNLSLSINRIFKCNSNMQPQFLDKNLFFAGSFTYYSKYKDLSERELDYVFVYEINSIMNNISFSKSEVSELKWLTIDEIEDWFNKHPNDFSSWFKSAFILVKDNYLSKDYFKRTDYI